MMRRLTTAWKERKFLAIMQHPMTRRLAVACLAALLLSFPSRSHALDILSGPSFTPAAKAPLAGVLQLNTDVASRISVLVSDGTDTWQRDFYDFATAHAVPLYGFKPGQTNIIQVTAYDEDRNAYTFPQLLTFVTAPLPADFPHSTVLTSEPDQMEPGDTLFVINNRTRNSAYITIMNTCRAGGLVSPGGAGQRH